LGYSKKGGRVEHFWQLFSKELKTWFQLMTHNDKSTTNLSGLDAKFSVFFLA